MSRTRSFVNKASMCIRTVADFQMRGKTVLFVSHSPEAVRAICRRVLVLERGRLLYDGPVDEGLDFYARLGTGGGPAGQAVGSPV